MRTVSGWVVQRSPVLVVVSGVLLSGILFVPLLMVVLPTPLAVVIGLMIGIGGLIGLVTWMYPRVRYDDTYLYLGRRTVPRSSLTRLERTFSEGRGSAYLTYRLITTAGPRARVLVAGAPLRPVPPEGLAALRDLIAVAPVTTPADGLTDDQRMLLASLKSNAATAVGADEALRELGILLGADPEPAVSPRIPRETMRAMTQDDVAAATVMVARSDAAATVRRLGVGGLVLAVVGALASAIVGAVLEETGGLTDLANTLVTAGVLGGILLGLVSGVVLCVAHDVDVRRQHQLARRAAGDSYGGRGLPIPYLDALARNGDWTVRGLVCVVGTLALIAFIVAIVLETTMDSPVPIVIAISSVAVCSAAVVCWRRLGRRRLERFREVVDAAGPRASLLVHGFPAEETDGDTEVAGDYPGGSGRSLR